MILSRCQLWGVIVLVALCGSVQAATLLTEGFEAAFATGAPPGWTREFKTGAVEWQRSTGAHGGSYCAVLYYASSSAHETYLVSPPIDLSGAASPTLEFWHKQPVWDGDQDTLTVCYKTSVGGTWIPLASYTSSIVDWTKETILLPAPSATYYLGFLGNAKYGYGVRIDDVLVHSGQPTEELVIGTGTSNWYFPLASYDHDARTQTIYLAGELGGPRSISSLALYLIQTPGQVLNACTIRMKHTGLSAYAPSPSWESTGWTLVYQANCAISATGWVHFDFNTLFSYDGVQNLMVDISFNNSSYSRDGLCYYSTPGGTRTICFGTNSYYDDPLAWSARTPVPAASTNVPNIKLVFAEDGFPAITTHPSGASVCGGSEASFSVTATGDPQPSYQWQLSTDNGVTWSNVPGATADVYTFTTIAADNGKQYRCTVSNSVGVIRSMAATLTIEPVITQQPVSLTRCTGQPAAFSVMATGTGLTYRWTKDGVDIPGATSADYTIPAAAVTDGAQAPGYQCVVTDSAACTNTSTAATLIVVPSVAGITGPVNTEVCPGSAASFAISVSNPAGVTYQWQISRDGGTVWTSLTGATAALLSFTAAATDNGSRFHCVVSNPCGAVISGAATLMVKEGASFTTHPHNRTVCAGNIAGFNVVAAGTAPLRYQWQISTDSGTTWGNIAGANAAGYTLRAGLSSDGHRFRCILSNDCGSPLTSNAARLNVVTDRPAVQPQAGGVPLYLLNRVAQWDADVWGQMTSGMNEAVWSLVVHDDKLIAGGWFTSAGGSSANYIAQWNGASWSSVGSGMNSSVEALTVHDGALIAGGGFTAAGGVSANHIAKWNGSAWSPLGSGILGSCTTSVYALTSYGSTLVAGGIFTSAGGTATDYIASWNGTAWSTLGTGMNNSVFALTLYGGQLIAGGPFTTAGGTTVNGIAKWNGSSWSSLGSGMNGTVYALAVYDGQLIAGGYFSTAGGSTAYGVAKWNGTTWAPLGTGTNGVVYALTVHDGSLVAGGDFTTAGGVAAHAVAKWNGSSWSPLKDGLNGPGPYALAVYDAKLIAGGGFTLSGNGYWPCWTSGDRLYVKAIATGNGSGCSWGDAITDLQVAMGLAANPDLNIHEIWVAKGSYVPTEPSGTFPGECRCASFALFDDLAIYGGFAGDEDPATINLSDRDLQTNETVLTNSSANSRNVIVASQVHPTAVLDGFTVEAARNAPQEAVSEFFIDGNPAIAHCTIKTRGDRYLDFTPNAACSDNKLQVSIRKNANFCGVPGEILPLPSIKQYPCDDPLVYDDAMTFDKLEIETDAVANLVNRQPWETEAGEAKAMYVKTISIGPGAKLNTGMQELCYQNLVLQPTGSLTDVPLMGFSLVNINMDCQEEFDARVLRLAPLTEGDSSVTQTTMIDGNGVMLMETKSAGMVAAKGSFGRAGLSNIVIFFDYLFGNDAAGAELIVSLSNDPALGQGNYQVGRIGVPASEQPGAPGSGRFARYFVEVPYEQWSAHLPGFSRGTYIELELQGTGSIYIDEFDPQVTCRYECASFDGVQGVTEADFLILLAEYGRSPMQTGHLCLDMWLTRDQHVDLSDLLSWDTYIAGGFNSCGAGGASTNSPSPVKPTVITSATFATNSFVVSGKPGGAGSQQDRIYAVDASGAQTSAGTPWSTPSASPVGYRGNGRLIRDSRANLYQLHGGQGLVRSDGVVVLPPRRRETGGLTWQGNLVSVGATATTDTPPKVFSGIPVTDVAFDPDDPNVVYVAPVLVWVASPSHTYRAAAKLVLNTEHPEQYTLSAVYGRDPWTDSLANNTSPVESSYSVTRLRELELDRTGSRLFVTSSRGDAGNDNEWLLIYDLAPTTPVEFRQRLTDLSDSLKSPTAMLVSSKFDKLYLASADVSNAGRLHRLDIAGGAPTHDGELVLPAAPAGHIRQITALSEDPNTGTLYVLGFQMPLFSEQQVFSNGDAIFTVPFLLGVTPADQWPNSTVSSILLSGTNLALPLSLLYLGFSPADFNADGRVDLADLDIFLTCASGPAVTHNGDCGKADFDKDTDVDATDFAAFQRAWNPGNAQMTRKADAGG